MEDKIDWSQYEVNDKPESQIDWSQYEVNENNQNKLGGFIGSPYQEDNEEIQIPEATGIFGIGSDLLSAALRAKDFAMDIPNKFEKSNKYIREHPASSIPHEAGQLLASTADMAKGIINAPYSLNQYLARKHLLPQLIGQLGKYIPHIPEDTGIERALGLEADPEKGDELIRAIPQIVTTAFGVKPTASITKNIFKAPDLKQAIRNTQAKVNAATDSSGKIFDTVEKEVGAKGVAKIPIQKSILKTAETFLAKTPANKELINRAKTGDYKALRELQADLRVKGEKALASKLSSENTMGEEILSTRDQVNKSIQQHLEDTGHTDLANLLNQARKEYGNIKKTYFSTPALAKVFGKSQKVPKKPMTLLTEESTEMKRFFEAHPEMKSMLEKALKHGKKKKAALIGLGVLGSGTTAGVTSHYLGK